MRFNKRAAKPPKFSVPPKPRPWHTKTAAETESKLQTSREVGLSETEALHRLQQYGSNEIKRGQRKTLLTRIKEQLLSFMIIILLAAALLSALLGQLTYAVVILAIVIINTVISLVQENKAEKSLEALQQLAAPAAKVYRAGNLREIAARDLVPGDLVVLETGALVPADLRLAEAANLKVMESMLTGESAPVEKKAAITVTAEALPGDRHNMAFMGTTVVYGRGKGLVAETGQSTQVGQIAAFIQAEKEEASPAKKAGSTGENPWGHGHRYLHRHVSDRHCLWPGNLWHAAHRCKSGGGGCPRRAAGHCHRRPRPGCPADGPAQGDY